MSTWRKKALESFPELKSEIQDTRSTIYSLFLELLPRARVAHRAGDSAELKKIYGFAKWCFEQKSGDLWNVVSVAFYEHLVDDEAALKDITSWITPDMFDELQPLFEARMSREGYANLLDRYRFRKRVRKRHGN